MHNTTSVLPETINYHFTRACQMKCKHCFAVFSDCGTSNLERHLEVVELLARAPLADGMDKPRRLNLVGGEATIHPNFNAIVECAIENGLSVSLVTNGFTLIKRDLPSAVKKMALVGVSIDSLHHTTNLSIGRAVGNKTISAAEWIALFENLAVHNIPMKINTTVTKHNLMEDFSAFIREANPLRWKVFQAMVVDGQNDAHAGEWAVSASDYDTFVARHRLAGVAVEAEPETLMRGSYCMISPDGRFYDSSSGTHQYSQPITAVGVEQAWAEVNFSNELFEERTKNYVRRAGESLQLSAD